MVRPVAERYRGGVGLDWAPNTLPWNRWPIDVSALVEQDRPAGKRGRVRAEGDRLVFEDGTGARFWGTNLAAYALFGGNRQQVVLQARRLAALGFNLVRIHHHDSEWVSPNIFTTGDSTRQLNDAALDDIDWWVKCLRDEGIYVWLDLKVGRTFRPGDNVPAFGEVARVEKTGRGFDYVNPRLQELEMEFAAHYLKRVNKYTGRSYLDDPAIVAALMVNEDDITTHFGNLMLEDKGTPLHHKMMRALVEASAARLKVSRSDAMRLWEPGPAKAVLADIEAGFFARTAAELRRLGFKGLLAGTSYWGDEPLYAVPSLGVGDVVDVHSYGTGEALSANPRYEANFISWIGAAQIAGKPLTISEWNVQTPTRDRFTAPLYLAAIASLQGWDAPMIFAHMQEGMAEPWGAGEWSTGYDPALTALMPAAAVMYRRQHVSPARVTYRFTPSRETLYHRIVSPANSATIRTLVEQSRLVFVPPDLPGASWDDRLAAAPKADGDIVVTSPDKDFIPAADNAVKSDTGELRRDWVEGVLSIDTPMSQAAMGWIGERTVALRDVEIRVDVPKATVSLTSLDGQPIATSARMTWSASSPRRSRATATTTPPF